MLLSLLNILLLFFGVTLGLAWPLTARLALDSAEKLLATVLLSLVGVYLTAWSVYVFTLPSEINWVLPVVACLGLALNRRALAITLADEEVRHLLAAQLIVTGWCVGALALVVSYSGGGWAGDWFGHWERMCFFLEHWPREMKFDGFDAVTSRPPLVNVVEGFFLHGEKSSFAHYQFISTLFGSLAFLPAAVLARRFRLREAFGGRFEGNRAIPVLAVLFMLNPLFVQNATFAWTKLPAAFFTLTALHFFLRAHDNPAPRAVGWLFATSLAAGLLAHYSVGPYAVILAVSWAAYGRSKYRKLSWWRATGALAFVGALVLATWFAWAFAVYGVGGTFLTNTSVTEQASTRSAQLLVMALNLRDTLVPHFLRTVDSSFLAQRSPWGWWRDWFFQLYQVNFFFAFGSVVWAAIIALIARDWRSASKECRLFWTAFVTGGMFLGVVVHGARDTWGLAHICLQPLVLLGLAFLAARWASLSLGWRRALLAGAALDFMLGIALHFGTQSYLLDRWLTPNQPVPESLLSYSQFATMNLRAKLQNHWVFLGDIFAAHTTTVLIALGALLLRALIRARGRATVTPP